MIKYFFCTGLFNEVTVKDSKGLVKSIDEVTSLLIAGKIIQ